MVYSVLIVGLGNIAMLYDYRNSNVILTHVKALNRDARFNIVCAVDPDEKNRKLFHEINNCQAYEDIDKAVAAITENIDLVVIASPTEYHYENYKSILEYSKLRNFKMMLMEKPLVNNQEDLNSIYNDVQQHRRIMVNLFRLYQYQINHYLALLLVDDCCEITVTYNKGLLHNGIHFFSLLLRYLGECRSFKSLLGNKIISHAFIFDKGSAIFQPSIIELEENSLVVKSKFGALYYLNGGRNSFYIDLEMNVHKFNDDEFNNYQAVVYSEVYERMIQVESGLMTDDSFDLAYSAQQWLSKAEGSI